MVLFSSVMNLVFEPPEQHRFVHLSLASIPLIIRWPKAFEMLVTLLQDAATERSTKVEGMFCLLKNIEEDKD